MNTGGGADPGRPLRDPAELGGSLRPAERWLVVLDFDGTLSPIVDHPDVARPAPGVLEVVSHLAERTPVAVVTGRPVDDVRSRLADLPLVYAGGHGADLVLADGDPHPLVDPGQVAAPLDEVEGTVRALVDEQPGWLVERKPASLAVHHRLADPDSVTALAPRVQAVLESVAHHPPGFDVLAGKAVVELRPSAANKGAALERIAQLISARPPLVIGDDVTDEDAFRMARSMGGRAILVAEQDRASAATDRIADPDAVVQLLTALLA